MSYASVAATNAPPPSEQPHPDPALLNTTHPARGAPLDGSSKVNITPGPTHESSLSRSKADTVYDDDDDPFSPDNSDTKRRANRPWQEAEAEGIYLLEVTRNYLFRPGVAGGLIGLINLGLLAGAGRMFYTQPNLRRDRTAVSAAVAATIALFSVEGYAAKKYQETSRGQAEARRAEQEGSLIYKQLREQIFRPGTFGGILGLVNTAVLGTVSYFSYSNWGRGSLDRRVVFATMAGLLTVWAGEGLLIERYQKKRN